MSSPASFQLAFPTLLEYSHGALAKVEDHYSLHRTSSEALPQVELLSSRTPHHSDALHSHRNKPSAGVIQSSPNPHASPQSDTQSSPPLDTSLAPDHDLWCRNPHLHPTSRRPSKTRKVVSGWLTVPLLKRMHSCSELQTDSSCESQEYPSPTNHDLCIIMSY